MGVVIYRRVTNVLEVPPDVLVNFIGRGLIVNRHEFGEAFERDRNDKNKDDDRFTALGIGDPPAAIHIEVDCGAGLGFGHRGDYGELEVRTGDGIRIDDHNRIAVDVGVGLVIDEENKLSVEQAVCDPEKTTEFTLLIDSALNLDGQMLKMKKKYQKIIVQKNHTGRVINILPGEITETTDDVLLNVCYGGYGYGKGLTAPERPSTETHPNFYQK